MNGKDDNNVKNAQNAKKARMQGLSRKQKIHNLQRLLK